MPAPTLCVPSVDMPSSHPASELYLGYRRVDVMTCDLLRARMRVCPNVQSWLLLTISRVSHHELRSVVLPSVPRRANFVACLLYAFLCARCIPLL